ncbi:exonuclease SbcCD subunit D [Vibrio fluvialis]|uniref:exonuclease SbcCD subunit D n=1 Tax=Vibrio fluvialis TaxID=676 RepID=UPI00192B934F|nr:exonuclease SbcCD subunit D [Vibrio fluvialis]MBL4239641.1 exonuclease SbcCD subunit D [Vibrio fluvialis]MBL4263963.1 exonuclease SbcCD subunit D [Vibrio fluvialis]MBL4268995.1 exonuclease SbcCD subunit D [Vibrio fluvialis]MBL4273305.1 exonuclease SbcCD subunit D [Vibrio fluvialis]MBO1438818.1 exonuclease SbcCD subunit D [Vibrio fluvialis]
MKFLHTSDWHLGRQFHNVSLLEDQRYVLKQLIDYLKNNAVDAVIVAGDVYDRSVPPTVAIELLDEVVSSICTDLNIPMIMIPGNHDGAKRLGFAAKQMKGAGLHIISDFEQMMTPVVLKSDQAGDVAFYGMPYNDPEQVRHHYQNSVTTHDEAHQFLCECIKAQCNTSQRHVLISHCFVDGAMESDSERPLSIGGSDRVNHEHFADFDYVALGHLHQPQKKGEEHIRYSGSLMKYSFSEQHQKKGMTLVELNDAGFVAAEHIPLSAPHDMRIIEGELDQLLEQGKTDPSAHDYLLVRLHDKHAILDPMEKLRKVYPNVLHLEKPGMLIGVDQEMGRARLARGEMDMFRDFFLEAKQEPLSEQQESAMAEVIQSLKQAEQH